MKYNLLFSALILLFFCSCKDKPVILTTIEGKQIPVSDSITIDINYDAIIKPYRTRLNESMNTVLSYAPETYTKNDGEYNTAIGNLMADVIYSEGNPIFNKRTNNNIDIVLLNHGGIRSIISKGNITTKTAFEVMPFENSIVVVALKGVQIDSMIGYLKQAKRAHPISGMELQMNKDFNIKKALVQGKPVKKDQIYYVATSDYLFDGGDRMRFFKPNEGSYYLDYKIRNAMLDYFKKTDTIRPIIDNRFTQTK